MCFCIFFRELVTNLDLFNWETVVKPPPYPWIAKVAWFSRGKEDDTRKQIQRPRILSVFDWLVNVDKDVKESRSINTTTKTVLCEINFLQCCCGKFLWLHSACDGLHSLGAFHHYNNTNCCYGLDILSDVSSICSH